MWFPCNRFFWGVSESWPLSWTRTPPPKFKLQFSAFRPDGQSFRPAAVCVRARFWKWASSRLAFPVWPSSAAAPNDCGRWQRRVIIMDRAHLMAVGGCVRGGAWNSPQPPVSPPHLFRVLERTKDLHLLWCQKAHPIGEEWFQSANSNKLTSGKSARHFDANTFSWRIRRYHFFLVLCGVIWYEKFFYSITTALKSISY